MTNQNLLNLQILLESKRELESHLLVSGWKQELDELHFYTHKDHPQFVVQIITDAVNLSCSLALFNGTEKVSTCLSIHKLNLDIKEYSKWLTTQSA